MSETLTNGVIVPDKGSRDWYADLRSNWLKLDSLMAGGNITVNPAQTEGILVATITVGGKEYKLYQQDGDVSVKIDPSAENAEYPLVASTSAEANTGPVVMAPAVTVNPSTGAVTATSFKGKLDGNASTATNATKAVQDGAGAVITDTYATKKELSSKADDANVVHKSGAETIAGTKTFSGEVQTNTIRAVGGGANITLTPPDNGGFAIRAFNGTTNKEFVGYPSGMLAWDNNEILTRVNGVTLGTEQTISGVKTFSDVTYYNKELRYRDTKYDWTDTSLDTWCEAGHVVWYDKTGNRRMHELVGTKGGVWRKAYYINENPYFGVDSDSNVKYWGTTFTWNNANILTDANQIMLAKNLSGTAVAPGGIIDCGNGNGKLKQWYLGADGAFVLANTLPTGIWKSTSFVTLAPNEGGIFIKLS